MHAARVERYGDERGAVLVEFALVALALSLLLAVTIDLGRLYFVAQAVQDAARVAGRELSVTALPAEIEFESALTTDLVLQRVFDPRYLVIDLDGFTSDAEEDACLASWPLVNRALRPVMIADFVPLGGATRRLLRVPGALLSTAAPPPDNPNCPSTAIASGLTVGIPRVTGRDADGVETIEWLPVVEEIRPDPLDPATGPFSLASTGPDRGVVAVRINYPFQAALLSGFQSNGAPITEPNIASPIRADDAAVTEDPASRPAPGGLLDLDQEAGPYAGPYGLGRQLALAQTVRPFRRLLAAQAIFRREVFQ